jgi:hypothetical protein
MGLYRMKEESRKQLSNDSQYRTSTSYATPMRLTLECMLCHSKFSCHWAVAVDSIDQADVGGLYNGEVHYRVC